MSRPGEQQPRGYHDDSTWKKNQNDKAGGCKGLSLTFIGLLALPAIAMLALGIASMCGCG